MLQTHNYTPFQTYLAMCPDENAIDSIYPLIKATFTLSNALRLAEPQAPIVFADEYLGEPGQTTLLSASDILPLKPATDVLLLGDAVAAPKGPQQEIVVKLRVSDRIKEIRVTGNRMFTEGFWGARLTEPMAFTSIPLIYENAFGGSDVDSKTGYPLACEQNPIGKGYYHKRGTRRVDDVQAPNLESADSAIVLPGQTFPIACFSPICAHWLQRRQFAGTYDETWQKHRAPYLPEDFDMRFFNVAPEDQQFSPYLGGGERIMIDNIGYHGSAEFTIPRIEWNVQLLFASEPANVTMALETVIIDARGDEPVVQIVWKGKHQCDKQTLKMQTAQFSIADVDQHIGGLDL